MGKHSKRQPKVCKALKQRLWNHLGRRCFYCGGRIKLKDVTVDHVFPRNAGYTAHANVIPACRDCNHEKDDTWPDVDMLIKIQELYDSAGEIFNPRQRSEGRMMMTPKALWFSHCAENRTEV